MCGIAGFIGESKKPVLTFQLISKLFEKSEIRGVDAAGYWGVESGDSGKILYHKEPGKSSVFVKKDAWRKVARYNPNLLLVHARGASKGVGEPTCNKNNHPFTSTDKLIGLVHNGRIEDHEYQPLRQKYEVNSECDSEILLRILEAAENQTPQSLGDLFSMVESHRMAGIRDIFSLINDGHMAVAIGERGTTVNNDRKLWLFRNRHRPLWIVDMREVLGQVFFVSEPKIWEDGVRECNSVARLVQTQKLIELPSDEVWFLKIDKGEPVPTVAHRFEVNKDKVSIPWVYDGRHVEISKRNPKCEVITYLNDTDDMASSGFRSKQYEEKEDVYRTHELETRGREINELVSNIIATAMNLAQEASIKPNDFQEIIDSLENVHKDLEGTYSILEK